MSGNPEEDAGDATPEDPVDTPPDDTGTGHESLRQRLGQAGGQTVRSLRDLERDGRTIGDRAAGLDPGGQLRDAVQAVGGEGSRIGPLSDDPTSGLGKSLADLRRAQRRYGATLEAPPMRRSSAAQTLTDVAARQRADEEAERERERERHEALVDVIATSAAATQEATLAVQRSIEEMASGSKATQEEALRIARASKTATLVGVWISVIALIVTSTIAVIAIVVASPTP